MSIESLTAEVAELRAEIKELRADFEHHGYAVQDRVHELEENEYQRQLDRTLEETTRTEEMARMRAEITALAAGQRKLTMVDMPSLHRRVRDAVFKNSSRRAEVDVVNLQEQEGRETKRARKI